MSIARGFVVSVVEGLKYAVRCLAMQRRII